MLNELFAKEADKTVPVQPQVTQNQAAPVQTEKPILTNKLMVNEQQQTKAVETVASNVEKTSQSLKEETIAPSTPQKSVETTLQKALNTPSPTTDVKTDTKESFQVSNEEVKKSTEDTTLQIKSSTDTLKENDLSDTSLAKKTETKDSKIDNDNELIQNQTNKSQEETTVETKDDSQVTIQDTKTDTTIKTTKQETNKVTTPKESLSQFASNLKEQIESYSPPYRDG